MTDNRFVFKVRSTGTVAINLGECTLCESKACISVCQSQGGPLVLDAERGVPAVKWSLAEIERGGCVECLGCELDCELRGRKAVTITLPMERFEEYLNTQCEPTVCAGAG
jgi:hypothetical protein